MLRSLIAFLHIFSLTFIFTTDINELKKDPFKAELITPTSIEQGNEAVIEVKFTVGAVKGFAKLTENLPSGIIAEAVDMGDATFTFSNGIMKIIWLNFPTEDEFSIKYKLKVSTGAPNEFQVGGKFSYLENNEKRSYSVFKKTITTGGSALAAQTESSEQPEKQPAFAKVIRTVESIGADKYKVTLEVTKSGIEGFCKIQEYTSFGGKMTEGELNGAIFSFIKNKGKLVWMSLPPEENFTVTYLLDLKNGKDKDVTALKGDFSFLEDNVTKKVTIVNQDEDVLAENNIDKNDDIPSTTEATEVTQKEPITTPPTSESTPTTVVVDSPELANNIEPDSENTNESESENTTTPKEPQPAPAPTTVEETPVLEQIDTETIAEVIEEEEEEEEEEEIIKEALEPVVEPESESGVTEEQTVAGKNEPEPAPVVETDFGVNSGVNYRVQIAAGKNVVDKTYFEKRHNWTNDFVIENHEGWVKYTVGSFQAYKDARDNRVVVNMGGHKFNGPFVTAYNGGTRITVQEALMISKQKWYK